MCGIAGLLGVPEELARPAAERMLAAMRHRGPDAQGIECVRRPNTPDHPAVLVHARLAILDLSEAGRQPMADRPPSAAVAPNWIVFNGEVFNYQQLHPALAEQGWHCRSRSDTEVILHGYRVWGRRCVDRFRGMFAWCLLDVDRGGAWLCRDRLGIKPLYYVRTPQGGFLFASELRSLLQAGPELLRPRVNTAALESYLAQGAVSGLDSIVSGVRLLGPGQSIWVDWNGAPAAPETYWHAAFAGPNDSAPASATPCTQRVADVLRESVRLRLISD